jgi:hypothetical protein
MATNIEIYQKINPLKKIESSEDNTPDTPFRQGVSQGP